MTYREEQIFIKRLEEVEKRIKEQDNIIDELEDRLFLKQNIFYKFKGRLISITDFSLPLFFLKSSYMIRRLLCW